MEASEAADEEEKHDPKDDKKMEFLKYSAAQSVSNNELDEQSLKENTMTQNG